MKAFILEKYGQPLVETDVPEPTAGPCEIVIDTAAASLNPIDAVLASGRVKAVVPLHLPAVMGFDVAGTVSEIGEGVTAFAVGDRVMSRVDQAHMGSFAERVSVDAAMVARQPFGLTDAESASLPLAGETAWQVLRRGGAGKGSKVLIHGGAGGVGSLAIQMAKSLGAEVATTVSARNAEYVRGLGADRVIDYHEEDVAQVLAGYDLVLDGVGEKSVLSSLEVLRPGGIVIGLNSPIDVATAERMGAGKAAIAGARVMSARVMLKAKRLGVRYEYLLLQPSGADLDTIRGLVESGDVRPQIGRELAFEDVPEAMAAIVAGGGRGKTVVVRR